MQKGRVRIPRQWTARPRRTHSSSPVNIDRASMDGSEVHVPQRCVMDGASAARGPKPSLHRGAARRRRRSPGRSMDGVAWPLACHSGWIAGFLFVPDRVSTAMGAASCIRHECVCFEADDGRDVPVPPQLRMPPCIEGRWLLDGLLTSPDTSCQGQLSTMYGLSLMELST